DLLDNSLEEIRPGYVKLKVSVEELKQQVIQTPQVQNEINEVQSALKNYIHKYYPQLKQVTTDTNLTDLKSKMLDEIKDILSQFNNVDQYAGYQIVADLWQNSLEADAELIAGNGFY